MQRISVDLPDPEGPQMTIFSPLATFRFMSLSTWKAPNHLPTRTISIAAVRPLLLGIASSFAPSVSCASAMSEYADE